MGNSSIEWNKDKNDELKQKRGVSFDDVVQAVEDDRVLYDGPHENRTKYRHQRMLIVDSGDYAYVVPYVIDEERGYVFLKTIYASRKQTKHYSKPK